VVLNRRINEMCSLIFVSIQIKNSDSHILLFIIYYLRMDSLISSELLICKLDYRNEKSPKYFTKIMSLGGKNNAHLNTIDLFTIDCRII
jgi:hypothetical protein